MKKGFGLLCGSFLYPFVIQGVQYSAYGSYPFFNNRIAGSRFSRTRHLGSGPKVWAIRVAYQESSNTPEFFVASYIRNMDLDSIIVSKMLRRGHG